VPGRRTGCLSVRDRGNGQAGDRLISLVAICAIRGLQKRDRGAPAIVRNQAVNNLEGQTKSQLHLASRVSVRRRVSAEVRAICLCAVGILEVSRIQDIEGLDAEFNLARLRPQLFGFVQCEIELSESRPAQDIASGIAEILAGRGNRNGVGIERSAESGLGLYPA